MSTLLFANNAGSTLAGAINNTTTTLNLAAGGGALFPNPSGGQYFVITAVDAATGLLREIMWCTGRSTDTLTVVRAQEGTTGLSWNAGDFIQNLWTAGQAAAMYQASQTPTSIVYYGVDVGAVNAMVSTVTPVIGSLTTGNIFEITPAYANSSTAVTLDISTLGIYPVVRSDGSTLRIGDIQAAPYKGLFAWDGVDSQFLLLNPALWNGLKGALLNVQKFTTSGTYTPTSGMKTCIALIWGPGGGSGGTEQYSSGTNFSASSAGAAGSFAEVLLTAAQIGASQTITLGTLGAAGSAGNHAGGNATATTFGSLVSVPGGGGSPGCPATSSPSVIGNANAGGLPTVSTGTVLRQANGQPSSAIIILTPSSGLFAGSYLPVSVNSDQHGVGGLGVVGSGSTGLPGNAGAGGYVLIYEFGI
jgi:hypothetical protein